MFTTRYHHTLFIWLSLLLAINTPAYADGHGQEVTANDGESAAITQLYADWRSAVADASIPRYLQALDSDVRLLPPGADPIVGAANYGKFLEPVFAVADYLLEVEQAPQIIVRGDTAVAEYTYLVHLTLKNPEQGVDTPGALTNAKTRTRYFDVLRKNAEGQWGVWRHTWHVLPE
ncbi:MAG: DUF4440 domain-containing protein [Pseudomonadota bacterium]